MKSYRKELWFNTKQRREFINITPQVEECLEESGIREGLILVNAMHITASVSSTMTNQVYIKIMRTGWKNLLRTNPFHIIAIIVQERIMAMLNELPRSKLRVS